jgi:hypothetical protein
MFMVGAALVGLLALQLAPVNAQDGISVECDNGASFDNGVEIIVSQMRAGFEYTATAVGIDGFDPVIAVLGENGGLCNDDSNAASDYAADLPTTGRVRSSNLSAQVNFTHNDRSGFQDISLVVGGLGNQGGEFILILEGMAVTGEDNGGDPFIVRLTEDMVDSDVPLTVYMLTRGQSGVDPLLYLADGDFDPIEDNDGNPIACDDAGSDLCWSQGDSLDDYSVTIDTGTLPGWAYDAYLSLDISGFDLSNDPDDNLLPFVMTSYNRESEGQYLLVFHIGIDG